MHAHAEKHIRAHSQTPDELFSDKAIAPDSYRLIIGVTRALAPPASAFHPSPPGMPHGGGDARLRGVTQMCTIMFVRKEREIVQVRKYTSIHIIHTTNQQPASQPELMGSWKINTLMVNWMCLLCVWVHRYIHIYIHIYMCICGAHRRNQRGLVGLVVAWRSVRTESGSTLTGIYVISRPESTK